MAALTICEHRQDVQKILRTKLREAHSDPSLTEDDKTKIAVKLWRWLTTLSGYDMEVN